MLEILGGKAKALILPGTDDKASHPRSKEVILKKTGILQKCFCAALAALLLLTFFGCSKKPSQNAAITLPEQETSHAGQAGAIFAPSTEFVSADAAGEYRYTKLPIEGYRVRSVFPASGNSVYVIATPCDASGRFLVGEDGVIPTQLIQYDLQTQQKTDFCYQPALNGARDIALSSASLAPDGSLWVLVCRFWRADDGESLTTDFTVERLNADGTVAEKVLLDGMNLNEEPEFLIGSDGSFLLYTFSNGMLSSFDTAGHLTAQEPLALLTEKFAADSDGQVWFIADAEDGAALQAVGSKKQVPISGISNGLPVLCYGADESGVLYMTDTTALYRVLLQTGAAEKIADLAKLNVYGGQPFSRTANGSFVFADRSSDVPALAALCPGASGGKQKSVLTLATVNPSGQTIAQVQEFNRSNSDYQVEILDFSALLDSGSYMDLFTTWNTAIAAGDTPDMIDFSNLPWHSFADRGLLLDLNTILPQEDILPWLWKSVSYHGANYTFPGCFTVETLVGKQSKLGDHQHWTVQEFLNLADSSDISIFSGMSRELFLFYMEQYLLDAFLDEETKTCSFDSEEFRSLLDYAATLDEPEELGFEVENSMLLIRRDLALAEPVILSSVGQMHSAESYTVGEPLAWVGWPGPNGTKVRPDAEIAVFKNTDHTDGAAAFLQFLLSDTSQTVLGRFAFPMTVSAFESKIAAAMETRNTNDPDIATEFTVDGTVYPVVPLSEEDAARYETFFENISAQIYYPWQAANILEAECGALWAGERTAAETAAQIQKRMELYLAENAG